MYCLNNVINYEMENLRDVCIITTLKHIGIFKLFESKIVWVIILATI